MLFGTDYHRRAVAENAADVIISNRSGTYFRNEISTAIFM